MHITFSHPAKVQEQIDFNQYTTLTLKKDGCRGKYYANLTLFIERSPCASYELSVYIEKNSNDSTGNVINVDRLINSYVTNPLMPVYWHFPHEEGAADFTCKFANIDNAQVASIINTTISQQYSDTPNDQPWSSKWILSGESLPQYEAPQR